MGEVGFIPSNYVKEKDALGLQNFEWYVADMSRQRAESLLKSEDKEGCFVVRNSSTKGLYTLSLYTKIPHAQVRLHSSRRLTKRFSIRKCEMTSSHEFYVVLKCSENLRNVQSRDWATIFRRIETKGRLK